MAGKCDLPLHGLTVVVDTPGPRVYIGRYDYEDEEALALNHAEVRDISAGESKEGVLARSARFGVFVNAERVKIPRSEIVSVRRLSEIEPDG